LKRTGFVLWEKHARCSAYTAKKKKEGKKALFGRNQKKIRFCLTKDMVDEQTKKG